MKIASIQAIPVKLQRDRESATGSAGSPTSLAPGDAEYRWSPVMPVLYAANFETALVKVTLDTGLHGWGEAQAPLAPEVACAIVDRLLKPVLLGAGFDGSVPRIAELWDTMYATMRVRGQTGGFMLDAIAGVDIALWDLAGKLHGVPVRDLIPGSVGRPSVKAYCSGLPGGVGEARERVAEGFDTLKLFFDSSETAFFDSFRELRAAVGKGVHLAVDALWRLTPESAARWGEFLDKERAFWLEAPLPPEDAVAHGALAKTLRTPVALGESYRTRHELAPFFRERAMRFVQPDLGRCGITETLRIAATARGWGVDLAPHVSIAMGPQIAAAIHVAAALESCDLLEYNPSVLAVANRYLAQPLECRAARYAVPDGPGLGCEVLASKL